MYSAASKLIWSQIRRWNLFWWVSLWSKLCWMWSLLHSTGVTTSHVLSIVAFFCDSLLAGDPFNPSQCDVWEGPSGVGGGSGSPPPAILALEQIFAQKSCFPKGWHQFQLIWPLFGNFFQKSPKKLAKIENPSKNG